MKVPTDSSMCTADGHWVFREIKDDHNKHKHKAKLTKTTMMMMMTVIVPLIHKFLRAGAIFF